MRKTDRKGVKLTTEQYEILKDYSESKGITMGESILEMSRDIQDLKENELLTISENTLLLCDNFDALTEKAKIPQWLKDAIKTTIRPIVLQGMINKRDIDFAGLRASWNVPEGIRLITCFDKE